MTVFEFVKDSVDIIDAAGRYGLDVGRNKKALCPFHNDRNPSLSFYRDRRSDEQRYKCFSCQAGGDVIDLVGFLANTPPLETVRELNQTYNLRLDVDKPIPSAEIQRRKRIHAAKQAFADWEKRTWKTLVSYLHLLEDWRKTYAPRHPEDEHDPRFVEALHQQGYIEYICDEVFIYGSPDDKKAFYNESRQMVERIARRMMEVHALAGNNPSGIVFPFEVSGYYDWAA